jgi:uncharacterized protein (AIM24 family)
MFCTNCGSQIPEGSNFCVHCGGRAHPVTAQTPVPAPPVAPQTVARSVSHISQPVQSFGASQMKCSWCGTVAVGTERNCPRCGAALDVRTAVSRSGWSELPARKDMAKLQFGNSFCQIEGVYVPVADMKLAAEDSIYFTHHVLLWKDTQVNITTMPLRGGWKRMFAGMPLIMTQAQGPGHIAFSKDEPGELIALPLQPGQSVDVREHMFLAATLSVQYDWFSTDVWYKTRKGDNDYETFYPLGRFMDRFAATATPGLLLLHAGGNVFVRDLRPSETILVKPTALIFKDPSVQMHLHFEHPNVGFFSWGGGWTNRCVWLRLIGPGRVAIQSVFHRLENEGGNMADSSYTTAQQW